MSSKNDSNHAHVWTIFLVLFGLFSTAFELVFCGVTLYCKGFDRWTTYWVSLSKKKTGQVSFCVPKYLIDIHRRKCKKIYLNEFLGQWRKIDLLELMMWFVYRQDMALNESIPPPLLGRRNASMSELSISTWKARMSRQANNIMPICNFFFVLSRTKIAVHYWMKRYTWLSCTSFYRRPVEKVKLQLNRRF